MEKNKVHLDQPHRAEVTSSWTPVSFVLQTLYVLCTFQIQHTTQADMKSRQPDSEVCLRVTDGESNICCGFKVKVCIFKQLYCA